MLLDLQNVASEEYQLRKLRLQLESIPERIDDAFGLLRELTPAIFNRLKPPSVPR